MKSYLLDTLFKNHGYENFRWIDPRKIVVSQWVRMKCTYGCNEYGANGSCPPNTPSVDECERFFSEYSHAVIFPFQKQVENPEDRHRWSKKINKDLLKLERAVFLLGYERTFLLFMDSCGMCAECPGDKTECKNQKMSRPSPEAMAVDVFTTVKRFGFPIEVLSDYTKSMNRYAFLLID